MSRGAKGADIDRAVVSGMVGVDAARSRFYFELVRRSLNKAARSTLEKEMREGKLEYTSEFARRFVAEGLERGRQEGEARAVLKLLAARGLQVDEEARQRIVACQDLEQLERWLLRAMSVRSVQELFEAAPSPVLAAAPPER